MVFRPTRMSAKGIDFLIAFEGEVLHVYNDPSGFATYGVGHLLARRRFTKAEGLEFGTKERPKPRAVALARSRKLLHIDLERFEKAVLKHVPWRWRRTQARFDALVSLAFNLGEEILTAAPPLHDVGAALQGRPVNTVTKERVADAIREFDKSDGHTLPGLTRRRRAEARLFTNGNYSTA